MRKVVAILEHKSRLESERYSAGGRRRPTYEFPRQDVNIDDPSMSLVTISEQRMKRKTSSEYSNSTERMGKISWIDRVISIAQNQGGEKYSTCNKNKEG